MIKVALTNDMILVRNIITKPEIWEHSVEDSVSLNDFYPETSATAYWLICEVENVTVGVISVHYENKTSVKIHPCLLSGYRSHSRRMIIELFKWLVKMGGEMQKVNISITKTRRIVYNLAKNVGFKDEGVNRMSFTKNGKTHDQWLLGLTRKEIRGML